MIATSRSRRGDSGVKHSPDIPPRVAETGQLAFFGLTPATPVHGITLTVIVPDSGPTLALCGADHEPVRNRDLFERSFLPTERSGDSHVEKSENCRTPDDRLRGASVDDGDDCRLLRPYLARRKRAVRSIDKVQEQRGRRRARAQARLSPNMCRPTFSTFSRAPEKPARRPPRCCPQRNPSPLTAIA